MPIDWNMVMMSPAFLGSFCIISVGAITTGAVSVWKADHTLKNTEKLDDNKADKEDVTEMRGDIKKLLEDVGEVKGELRRINGNK